MALDTMGSLALAITGISLAAVLREIWVSARRYHAPPGLFAVMLMAAAVWVTIAATIVLGVLPGPAIVVPSIVILFLAALGNRLIPLLGGPVGTSDLLRAYTEIGEAVTRPNLTRVELDELRRKIVDLRRYRNPKSAEFIDAAQSMLIDWADGRLNDLDAREARRQHVLKLGDDLFLGDDA